jgi:transposase
MGELYVGIDVSKDNSTAQGLNANGEKLFYLEFPMNRKGFSDLMKAIDNNSGDYAEVKVAMESTACYHITLFSYLTSKGVTSFIITPLLISNFVKLSLRKTKTDKKDALAIARFLFLHKDSLEQRPLDTDMTDLRDLSRQRESLLDQMTAVKLDMKRLLNITFPELEKIAVLYTKSMYKFLTKYPSAQVVREANSSDIAELIIPGSMGRNSLEDVQRIKEAAETSIGTASFTKEIIIKQKASVLLQLNEHLKEITSILIEHCQSMMQEDMEILKSIRGIGDKSATNFLVEMGGDISIYENHKKLIAMAGIDPAVYQSGKHEGRGKISKRGNKHLRRVIWLMAEKVVMFNDFFKTYYLKRREDGLPYKKAIMATAHKLIRTIFAMLSNRTLFNAKTNC